MRRETRARGRRAAVAAAALLCLSIWTATAVGFDPAVEAENFSKTTERERLITKTPEFQALLAEKEVENNLENVEIQTTDTERNPYANICWNRNRECAGDVRFYDWAKDGFGIRRPVLFTARSGATISGNVWATEEGRAQRPAVVITTGSVQAPETLYWGTAAALARNGYVVLTYDVQGQGRSDTFGVGPDRQEGVPSQAGQPFYDGTEDALDFLLSTPADRYLPRPSCGNANEGVGTDHSNKQRRRVREGFNARHNPLHRFVDERRIGIAGHSLGASAVSYIGQLDRRVDAIVAWDNLSDSSQGADGRFPAPECPSRSSKRPPRVELTKPALGLSNDYGITPTPNTSDPDPQSANEAFLAYKRAGVDSMQVNIRGGTHEEYAFIPGQTIPLLGLATFRGMDLSTWYTKAWLDRYVACRGKGCRREADRRLLSDRWRKDRPGANVDPGDDGNLFSFYLRSRYDLRNAGGRRLRCNDMRKGCGSMRPDGLPPRYFQITDAYGEVDGPRSGRACAVFQSGTDRDDRLRGTPGGDRIEGRKGDDVIRGRGGDDCLHGNRGDDRLFGGPGEDRLGGGPGADLLNGGAGDDRINARGGGRDVVRCGPGRDVVRATRTDTVARDCEIVRYGSR